MERMKKKKKEIRLRTFFVRFLLKLVAAVLLAFLLWLLQITVSVGTGLILPANAAEKEALKPHQEQYEETMAAGKLAIETIEKPENVVEAMSAIKGLTHALTSERELKAALTERIKELGIVYNKETKAYEWAKQ